MSPPQTNSKTQICAVSRPGQGVGTELDLAPSQSPSMDQNVTLHKALHDMYIDLFIYSYIIYKQEI